MSDARKEAHRVQKNDYMRKYRAKRKAEAAVGVDDQNTILDTINGIPGVDQTYTIRPSIMDMAKIYGVSLPQTYYQLDGGNNSSYVEDRLHRNNDTHIQGGHHTSGDYYTSLDPAEAKRQREKKRYNNQTVKQKTEYLANKKEYQRNHREKQRTQRLQDFANGNANDEEKIDSGLWEPDDPMHGIEENDLDHLEPDDGALDIYEDDEARAFNEKGGGGTICEEYKDVDVVSTVSESSSSMDTGSGHRSRDTNSMGSRVRVLEEDSCDSESVASNFEFHKERGASARSAAAAVVPPFSKPAPSKWDDAQKWIASPTTNRPSRAAGGGAVTRKMDKPSSGFGRLPVTKVVLEATEEIDTKRIDPSQEKREIGWQKAVDWAPPDPYPEAEPCSKTAIAAESMIADSAVTFNRHDSSTPLQSATACIPPPSTVRSVSMRDMGTEMTPIASQEPSRTGTPVRATSPNCSRPTTPRRTLGPNAIGSVISHGECSNAELSEQELQTKTRREIMLLGTQLGKTNIAAWASKKEEEKGESLSLKTVPMDQSTQNITEIRAAAWEEAEKAKYLARFKREEIKIQAWEDHQKAKIEAEMRKIEVEVERMRARAQDKLMTQLASARHNADEKRATAELKRNRAAARTAEQAEHIRRTGRVPASFGCWNWCS